MCCGVYCACCGRVLIQVFPLLLPQALFEGEADYLNPKDLAAFFASKYVTEKYTKGKDDVVIFKGADNLTTPLNNLLTPLRNLI